MYTMDSLHQTVLIITCIIQLLHALPVDQDRLSSSHFAVNTNHSGVQSAEISSESSSLELAEKPYVPIDPAVIEGDVQSARKPLPMQPDTSADAVRAPTQKIQIQTKPTTVKTSPEEYQLSVLSHSSMNPSSTIGQTFHDATVDLPQQPEEINYLNRALTETAYKPQTDPITTVAPRSLETSREYSDEDDALPATPSMQVTSAPMKNIASVYNNSNTTSIMSNLTISTNLPTTDITTFSFSSTEHKTHDNKWPKNITLANSTENPTTVLTPTERNQQESPSTVTKIPKDNIRFTISAEDTRQRTKAESSEMENGKSSSVEAFVENESNRATILSLQTDKNDNGLEFRQSKAIEEKETTGKNFNSDDISSKSSSKLITMKIDIAQTLPPKIDIAQTLPPKIDIVQTMPPKIDIAQTLPSKTDIAQTLPPKIDIAHTLPPKIDIAQTLLPKTSLTSTATIINLESLEALFTSLNPHPLNKQPNTTPSLITSPQTTDDSQVNIATEHATHEVVFHTEHDDVTNNYAILDATNSETTVDEEIPTTTGAVERATIRRRLLRPLTKLNRSTKRKKIDHTTSEIGEFTHTEVPPTTSTTPLKTLHETIAPPVLKSSNEVDYPLDVVDQVNFFESDVTELPIISTKTTNTIIISSIVGGCAVVFFAFLTIFCKCKQKYNRRMIR